MDEMPSAGTGANDQTSQHEFASGAPSDTTSGAAGGSSGTTDESFGWTGSTEPTGGNDARATAERMIGQLQGMIDNLATQAAPVVRQIGAKAAELAAVAAERAGPIAHKAADVTADAGVKLAERSRTWAADLRRSEGGATDEAPVSTTGSDGFGDAGTTGATIVGETSTGMPSNDDPAEGRRDVPTE
jgi:hypothetical protein